MIGINLEGVTTREGRKEIEEFKALRGLSFPTLYDTKDSKVANRYGVTAIPTTFLIDRKGYIRKIWLGYRVQWQQEFQEEIQKYLKEDAS